MSRSDSFVGLNGRAWKYLNENAKWGKRRLVDERGKILEENREILCEWSTIYTWLSMFGCENPLRVFTLKKGGKVYEVVQADPWASGPNIFTCLAYKSGKKLKKTMWKNKEIWDRT
jgi:hypothetical protein